MKEYLEQRIQQLKDLDVEFCNKRWDLSLSQNERDLYREQSNSVTLARQELESALQVCNLLCS